MRRLNPNPIRILVVPVVNESLEVEAGNYLLSTLPIPLAERGYYVFPVNTVKFVLEQEGYYEADRVAQQDPAALAALFGADAILYLTFKRWDAQYVVLATTITVQLEYRMVAADGQEIWKETRTKQYTPDGNQNAQASGLAALLAAAVTAAAARANPNYLELASQANNEAIGQGFNAVPLGPYVPKEPAAATAPPPAAPAAGRLSCFSRLSCCRYLRPGSKAGGWPLIADTPVAALQILMAHPLQRARHRRHRQQGQYQRLVERCN